jgi:beta-barrel assembly-enhancing protease
MISAAQAPASDLLLTEEERKLDQQLADLQKVIAAPTFQSLPSDTQFEDLNVAAKLAFARDQPRTAYEYVVHASDMPQATPAQWLLRMQAASRLGSESDAVKSLTVLAQRWPEQVANLDFRPVNEILRESDAVPHPERLALFRALYAMHWTLKGGVEPSIVWRELAFLLLEKGLLREAIEVSTRVTDVYVLVAMRADRRFDAVVAAHPAQFDINAAGERELKTLEAASDAWPKSLELKSRVIYALFQQQHYAAMLAETDSVLLAIRTTSSPTRLYEDYYAQFEWFLNLRSYALARNGRWDEAAAELAAASASGRTDQLINLGALYCRIGRPKDALEAIARVGADTSPNGAMQLESVRLDAAVQLGDQIQVTRSMQYISAHSADAPNAYMKALRSTKQLDRLGQLLVAQLLDPEERLDTLVNIQDYAAILRNQWEIDSEAVWRAAIARKEVQAAIKKVGRIERYHLERP